MGQVNQQGQWSTLPYTMTINPVHAALLHNNKILIVAGSGNCSPDISGCPSGPPYGPANGSGAALLDLVAGSITHFTVNWDMFCNGMTVLPDGRAFINGGTLQSAPDGGYSPFHGSPNTSIFDPATNTFTDVAPMVHGRWYPTVITLDDGRVITFSGFDEDGQYTNTTVQFYTVGSGWSPQYSAPWTPPLYPRLHLLPSGKIFYSGETTPTRMFDPSNQTWSIVANTVYGITRTYGSAVLLPLTPANNYDPRVIYMGGGNPGTATTEVIDLGAATPAWTAGPKMSQPRIEMNATILPTGKVLALGGSLNDEDAGTASYNADLYDPDTNTFSSAGRNAFPRLYHSVSLLLPDATVWFAGGNPTRGNYEPHMEIYKPAYLFNSDGSLAARPSITSAPAAMSYGSTFVVQTPDAASISSVVLMRDGSVTHAFDMDQRLVGMNFTAGNGTLTVTSPPTPQIAPPADYMLFLLNNQGVPSVATFVQLNSSAPDFNLSAPANASVNTGNSITATVSVSGLNGFNGAVSLACSGLPANATCSFNPSSLSPGSGSANSTLTITAGAGTQVGSYTVNITGTGGSLLHSSSVALTVQSGSAPDFVLSSLTLTPSTISAGASSSTSVSVSPANGFQTAVALTCGGLPAGANCAFNPASIANGSGSSVLNINTQSTTPAGTYPISVMGTSGSLSHTTMLTLTIAPGGGGFSLSAPSPTTATVSAGASASTVVTITPVGGFSGTVNLSCSIATSASPAPTCSPASVSVANGPAQVAVKVTTTAPHMALRSLRSIFYAMFLPLAGIALWGAGFAPRRKNLFSLLLMSLLLSGLMLLAACGGGTSAPSGGGGGTLVGGTPTGTYTVTISATSGSVAAQPTTFALTVQ